MRHYEAPLLMAHMLVLNGYSGVYKPDKRHAVLYGDYR